MTCGPVYVEMFTLEKRELQIMERNQNEVSKLIILNTIDEIRNIRKKRPGKANIIKYACSEYGLSEGDAAETLNLLESKKAVRVEITKSGNDSYFICEEFQTENSCKPKNQDAASCLETSGDDDDYSNGEVDDSDDYSDLDDGDRSDSSGDNGGDNDNNKKCDKRKDEDGDVSDIVNNSNKKSDGGYDPSTPCLNNFHFNTPILEKSDVAKATNERNPESVLTMANSMAKLVDTISGLHQTLSTERAKSESLMSENFSLKLRNQELETLMENILGSQAKQNKVPQTPTQRALEIRSNLISKAEQSKPENNAPTQGLSNRKEASAPVQPTFQSQWDSYVNEKSRQYEKYRISRKVDELKTSNNPKGKDQTIANRAETNNKANFDSSTTPKKKENTQSQKQKSVKAHKPNKASNPVSKPETNQAKTQPSNKSDNTNETQPWRKGTTLIAGDSILYGIDERKICQNGSVKVRVFSGTTIEDLRDYYIKPLLRKKPSKVILHVGTNNASLKNANPDQIVDALLDFKKDIEEQLPGCVVVLSMPTKRFDNEEYGKIIESLNKKIIDLGIDAINNNNIFRGDIGRKGLHLNAKGTSKLTSKLVSKLRCL